MGLRVVRAGRQGSERTNQPHYKQLSATAWRRSGSVRLSLTRRQRPFGACVTLYKKCSISAFLPEISVPVGVFDRVYFGIVACFTDRGFLELRMCSSDSEQGHS